MNSRANARLFFFRARCALTVGPFFRQYVGAEKQDEGRCCDARSRRVEYGE